MLMNFEIEDCEKVMSMMVDIGFNLECFVADDIMEIGNELTDIATIVNAMTNNGFWFKLIAR